ncbi:MAG: glycosyl hydrolase [Gemmatimonadales bacterium]|nr:glycosyl hydrolase [Gemmatimonadales bacterium]
MPRTARAAALVALALLATAPRLRAQAANPDSTALAAMQWREIGPFRGGRSVAVAGSDKRPLEYWMGTTGGGVFRTTDGGLTWGPASDGFIGGTIGAIAVSESNPDIVWVGTGEYPIRGNVSHGDGVYRTTDGGKSWQYAGLVETRQVSRLRVHPKNPDVAWVAAQGHVWAPNPERGIFKTTDGGKHWRKVLFRNDSTGASDLAIDPSDPNILYAALWQAGRTPWMLVSGGAGSGIFKSTDGGETWKELSRNPGLPKGLLGNIGITVSPAKPKRLWALIEADSGGVFRSDDGGDTWTRVNDERKLRQRAWYYSKIYADPKDTNIVYASNVSFHKSTDGGRTWRNIRTPHGDSHDLWLSPSDNQRMIEGNDGGANVSVNGARSWTGQAFATAQFYHVTTTNHFPYRVCGAQQDNSTLCGPSRAEGGIGIAEWQDAGGGESGYIASTPDDPDIVYAGSYGGLLTRKDLRTGLERDVNPWPLNPMGHPAADATYRMQWTFPIVFSPHDPKVLYVGSSVVFRTTDGGQSFTPISKDLTRNDPRTLGSSGGPITKDQTGVEYYGTVFTIAESPLERGVIWTGSDDGLVHVTRDNGVTWTDVTPKDMAPYTRVSIVEASRFRKGTLYVAANRFQLDDLRPYLWRTTDYGATWTRIDAGLPVGEFTRVIREDEERQGLLFAGTERGVWASLDDGATWFSLRRNLPAVPVHDLAVKEGDLVAATHGRSFWILDDLTPLRQWAAELKEKKAHLYAPRAAYRINWGGGGFSLRSGAMGANPPSGAVVHYALKQGNRPVTIEFLDGGGRVIRRFQSDPDSLTRADSLRIAGKVDSVRALGVLAPAVPREFGRDDEAPEDAPRRARPPRVPNKAGLNRFAWNLRAEDASSFDRMILWAGGVQGPVVPPGSYAVRLTVDGESQSQPLVIRRDPRASVTDAEIAEQHAFLLTLRDRVSAANDAVKTIRHARRELADREGRLPAARKAAVAKLAAPWRQRLGAIEEQLYQVRNRSGQDPLNYPIRLNNQLSALAGSVGGSDHRPTEQAKAVFAKLDAELGKQLAALQAELGAPLAALNAELQRAGLASIAPRPVDPPAGADDEASGALEEDEEEEGEARRW